MATETTTPSEYTMNESIEEKMEELSIEKIEDAQDTSIPEAEEKKILKEEETHEVSKIGIPEDQQTREVDHAESETLQDHDSLKVAETETPKEQDSHEITDNSTRETSNEQEIAIVKEKDAFENAPEFAAKESSNEQEVLKDKVPADANASDLVAEEKWKNEASESVEADPGKEVNVAEVREVSIPTVDHRSGAGDESKTEDVPTTVVHETSDGVNPSPRRSGDIFQNVGSKMLQSVQKLKNVISGKPSKDKSSESTD